MLTEPTAEATTVIDTLPPELTTLATRKPNHKPAHKSVPPAKHLIGTNSSVVHAQYDEDSEQWVYHCIGPAGITAAYLSSRDAKTAYTTLVQNQRP